MFKKLAIGCSVLVVLFIVAGGVGSYMLYKKAASFIPIKQLEEIGRLNEQVKNKKEYKAPENGQLTPKQVERFVTIQQEIHDHMGKQFEKVDEKYKEIKKKLDDKGREANVSESLEAWRDMIDLVVQAKRSQVKALNSAGMSLGEYGWIRAQTLAALGYGMVGASFEAMARSQQGDMAESDKPKVEVSAMEHNRKLVEGREEELVRYLPLSFMGI